MTRQIELLDNQAALVLDLDGNIKLHIPEDDSENMPVPFAALLAVALQLSDNDLFVESLLEWLQSKLDEAE